MIALEANSQISPQQASLESLRFNTSFLSQVDTFRMLSRHVLMGFLWDFWFPPPTEHAQVANSSNWVVLTKPIPDLNIGLRVLRYSQPLLLTFCSQTWTQRTNFSREMTNYTLHVNCEIFSNVSGQRKTWMFSWFLRHTTAKEHKKLFLLMSSPAHNITSIYFTFLIKVARPPAQTAVCDFRAGFG